MKLDWKRVLRTAIQSAAGAGAAFVTAIIGDYSARSLIVALVEFFGTVITAVLMNISNQAKETEEEK